MTVRRLLLGAASILTAVVLQQSVLSRLPLPGAPPDLVLVLVVAFALTEGPLSGLLTGFAAGLLVDATADHQLGRLALAYALAGYATAAVQDETERSTLQPFAAVALGALGALLLFSAEGLLLGDPRILPAAVLRSAVSSVPYSVVLTPFVVPLVTALVRRLNADPMRR